MPPIVGYNLETKQKLKAIVSVFSSPSWCVPFTAVVIILNSVQRSPIRIENGNLSMSENLVTTSAYAELPTVVPTESRDN